jgi:hypothetical protein
MASASHAAFLRQAGVAAGPSHAAADSSDDEAAFEFEAVCGGTSTPSERSLDAVAFSDHTSHTANTTPE